MSNEKQTNPFPKIEGDLELDTPDSSSSTSPDYQLPDTAEQSKSKSFLDRLKDLRVSMREKKVGRKAAAVAAIAAGGLAVERSIAADTAAEIQHVQEMNATFEPIVKPAAEKAAQFAVDKIAQVGDRTTDMGYGKITQDSDDATRFDIYFSGEAMGTTYTISAEVGKKKTGEKDEKGNDIEVPDTAQVKHVEIFEKSGDNASTTTLSTEDPIWDRGYWGASRGFENPVQGGAYSTYDNEGQYADDIDDNVRTARNLSEDTEKLIAKLSSMPKAS